MKVRVLGSGSSGNAIAFSTGMSTILVDVGFGFRTLARRAALVGLDLGSVEAVVLTHEHNDHACGTAAFVKRVSCPVFASQGTLAALDGTLQAARRVTLPRNGTVQIGSFSVATCPTRHDASEPVALAVRDTITGSTVGVAYDVGRPTVALTSLLKEAACLILEANHDDRMLRSGPYPVAVQRRIAGPDGHLSNRAAADLAAELCHPRLDTVVLAHVSDRCNQPELAQAAVAEALTRRGFRGRVLVASQAEPLEPFEVGPAQYALDVFN
ncbi:MAG: MBL fold metallo-hydrolase [Gemmatimonadota bacterium]|nr:MBL fold metallo-hydrolase [Gemmatimonadota bacterium]